MATPQQMTLIRVACQKLGQDDSWRKMVLWNVAGVESSKDLGNAEVEEVMAVLESMGFRHQGKHETYWRDKTERAARYANERVVRKIEELAQESRYALDAMCRKFSNNRTCHPGKLTPREAWMLIEMYKTANAREAS
jgi:phage gp16-like protein